jgi:hypothetical protein
VYHADSAGVGDVLFRSEVSSLLLWLAEYRMCGADKGCWNSAGMLGVNIWGLLPFSRGNVTVVVRAHYLFCLLAHSPRLLLQSTDPFTKPRVHVGYFGADIDMKVMVAGARAVRRLFAHPALSCVLHLSHPSSCSTSLVYHSARPLPSYHNHTV